MLPGMAFRMVDAPLLCNQPHRSGIDHDPGGEMQ
jgi:hypothetical protein